MRNDYYQKVITLQDFIIPLMPHGCHLTGFVDLLQLLSHLNNSYNHSNAFPCSPSKCLPTIVYRLQHIISTPSHCIPLATIHFHLQTAIFKCPLSLSLSTIPYQLPPLVVVNKLILQRLPLGYNLLFSIFFKMQKYYGRR